MLDIPPYLTLWQIAEKWSGELNHDPLDIAILLKRATASTDLATTKKPQRLIVWPTACFSGSGDFNEWTAARAMIVGGPYYYFTEPYKRAVKFLNSGSVPIEITAELKEHFAQFAARREDFEQWCISSKLELPLFWGFKEFTPGDYLKRRTIEGVSREKIAIELVEEHGVTYLELARVMELDDGLTSKEVMALKKRGERFYKRAKGPKF